MELILMGGGKLAGLIYYLFSDDYTFAGYIDDFYENAYVEKHYFLKRLGSSKMIDEIDVSKNKIVIAIGSEGDLSARLKYIDLFFEKGFSFAKLIHSSSTVATNAEIGEGTIIQNNVVIDPKVSIGNNCIISTNSVIRHDSILSNNVFIAPGVIVNGSSVIGDNTFIGTGSIVIQKRVLGSNCTIGAGSCVTKDISSNSIAFGVPAKEKKN